MYNRNLINSRYSLCTAENWFTQVLLMYIRNYINSALCKIVCLMFSLALMLVYQLNPELGTDGSRSRLGTGTDHYQEEPWTRIRLEYLVFCSRRCLNLPRKLVQTKNLMIEYYSTLYI